MTANLPTTYSFCSSGFNVAFIQNQTLTVLSPEIQKRELKNEHYQYESEINFANHNLPGEEELKPLDHELKLQTIFWWGNYINSHCYSNGHDFLTDPGTHIFRFNQSTKRWSRLFSTEEGIIMQNGFVSISQHCFENSSKIFPIEIENRENCAKIRLSVLADDPLAHVSPVPFNSVFVPRIPNCQGANAISEIVKDTEGSYQLLKY